MEIKPRTPQEILETLHNLCQSFGRGRSGVHRLDPVVFRLCSESVGGVHQKTLALAFAAAMAVSPKVLRVEKSCVWFALNIIFDKFRALYYPHLRRPPYRNSVAGRFAPLTLASRSRGQSRGWLAECSSSGGDGDGVSPTRCRNDCCVCGWIIVWVQKIKIITFVSKNSINFSSSPKCLRWKWIKKSCSKCCVWWN